MPEKSSHAQIFHATVMYPISKKILLGPTPGLLIVCLLGLQKANTMAKDSYYFKHDCNARNDVKILNLRMEMGMEGYGIYFALIEILREEGEHKLPLSKLSAIAFDLRVDIKCLKKIITSFGLFIVENNMFYSRSLLERMEDYNTMKTKRIEAGKKGRAAQLSGQMPTESTPIAGQTPADARALDYTTTHYTTEEKTTLQQTTPDNTTEEKTILQHTTPGNTTLQHTTAGNNPLTSLKDIGFKSLDTLKQVVAADDKYVSLVSAKGIKREYVPGWLDAFNRMLTFRNEPLKTEPDYRAWFANWIMKLPDARTMHPDDYSPVKKPVSNAPPQQYQLTKTPEQILAERQIPSH